MYYPVDAGRRRGVGWEAVGEEENLQGGHAMMITLNLQPDIERGLLTQATARGLSLSDFLQEIVVREARVAPEVPHRRTGQELIDACAKVRGTLTDEEVDTLFSRNRSSARPVDFE